MNADLPTLLVEKVGLRRFECPAEPATLSFACIDLHAVRDGLQDERGALRRGDRGLVSVYAAGADTDNSPYNYANS